MPLLPYITQPLLPGHFYHIYNRGNEKGTRICYDEDNYKYFLKKLGEYMTDYWDTFAYCVLPDHYHLAVRIKPRDEVLSTAARDLRVIRKDLAYRLELDSLDLQVLRKLANLSSAQRTKLATWCVSERFRRFNLGYTKAINKQQNRRGSLMQKPFRRKQLSDIRDMKRLIRYIHRNPVHHGHSFAIEKYKWSSFGTYISQSPTKLKRAEALNWFNGIKNFLKYQHFDKNIDKFDEPD